MNQDKKIEVLNRAIDKLKCGGCALCDSITSSHYEVTGESLPMYKLVDAYYREILYFKPKKMRYDAHWWHPRRNKKRIRVLKKVIKLIQNRTS